MTAQPGYVMVEFTMEFTLYRYRWCTYHIFRRTMQACVPEQEENLVPFSIEPYVMVVSVSL